MPGRHHCSRWPHTILIVPSCHPFVSKLLQHFVDQIWSLCLHWSIFIQHYSRCKVSFGKCTFSYFSFWPPPLKVGLKPQDVVWYLLKLMFFDWKMLLLFGDHIWSLCLHWSIFYSTLNRCKVSFGKNVHFLIFHFDPHHLMWVLNHKMWYGFY